MKSRNIQADILAVISDGKVHTTNEIAEKIEVSQITVKRHIQSLAYSHNIETFHGGDRKGGVRLITDKQISLKGLDNDELQLIIEAIESLQDSNMAIKVFTTRLKSQLQKKENGNENFEAEKKRAICY